MPSESTGPSFSVEPIGYVRSDRRLKFETPRQPESEVLTETRVELLPGRQFELALQDLEGFERVWLVAWFHLNQNWRPRVLPPRGPAVRRGVFSTRSPHRPNPIGLTCATLHEVRGLTLVLGDLDLTDGTPILDIKPYIPYADAFPESGHGWVEEVNAQESRELPYAVVLDPLAESQVGWLLDEWGVDLLTRAQPLLERDPSPHRTRRILAMGGGEFRMACGPWRLFFRVVGTQVVVLRVASGLSDDSLLVAGDADAHRAFRTRWGPSLW